MKKNKRLQLKASVTVEMSYILPVLLLIFLFTVYAIFYYHDKNILIGAACETAVVGSQEQRWHSESKSDLEAVYRERVAGKLILMKLTKVTATREKEEVVINIGAEKSWMKVSVVQRASVPHPETKIRNKRKLESVADSLEGKE